MEPLFCTICNGNYLLDEEIEIRERNKYLPSAYHGLGIVLSWAKYVLCVRVIV